MIQQIFLAIFFQEPPGIQLYYHCFIAHLVFLLLLCFMFLVCSLCVLLCRSLCFYVRLSHLNKDYLLTYLLTYLFTYNSSGCIPELRGPTFAEF